VIAVADPARGAFAGVHRSGGLRQIIWQSSRTGRPQLTEVLVGHASEAALKQQSRGAGRTAGLAIRRRRICRRGPASRPGGLSYQTKVTSAVTPSALIMLPVAFREATERLGAELRRRPSRHDNEYLVTAQHPGSDGDELL
jgi:hypothetical protein